MNDLKDIERALRAPFPADQIEWRVQQAGIGKGGKPYCMVVPYITNRAIQNRLDEVFGTFGWENSYKPSPDGKGYLCGITVTMGEKKVTKWDGAEYTNIEALKGALSDSMKRAGAQLGIGRYLYDLDAYFASCIEVERRSDGDRIHVHYENKKARTGMHLISWCAPDLPEWALPQTDYSDFYKAIEEAEDLAELRDAFANAYKASQVNQDPTFESLAIKLKDTRKARIIKHLNEVQNKKISDVRDWMTSEAKILPQLPTTVTVESMASKIRAELKIKVKDFCFEHHLFDEFETIVNERLSEIKGNK